ncbi:DNA-binding response regulator, OmpR family, contains REC and winged-helix (wHTH) domain [Anaerocolumna jejuensis DSM 15929]|uniref:Heme response regulator HssR n=1 Tax=Anaerocolumna jejuensis DSM 15929 TaxID=1121322 RepID=A0A1M6QYY8_9FIRM|nr:response regulator transcription factor [Anaerocolumna jejuensis]SHK25445.1 DNA-binding response regulator, OmpR family, contains REC and winged-helix (wHTH) domain [Anaerocolumna jejuensis DSM 15929]
MFSILVVEDDETLNKMICAKLKQEQFSVHTAFDGEQALEVMDEKHIDLIVCDIMMPRMNGYELTDTIRNANYTLPILMVTAKDQIEDMEKGFAAGTDDYLIKPFNMKELVLRAHALLRRSQIASERRLAVGHAVLDYDALTVVIAGEEYNLPPKEFYLLFKLLSNPNHIFTRLELMDEIWGMDTDADERTVDSHIKKLRRKFEGYPDFELITIRGLGYKAKIN